MKYKVFGTILGAIGTFLWFTPIAYVQFGDEEFFQAGNHIGGIAYLLLFALITYAILSLMGQHIPRIITGSIALAVSLLFLVEAGSSAAWGLYGLIFVSALGVILGILDSRASKQQAA